MKSDGKPMRTALVHYWLTNMRGGENVFAEIASLYPDADIYTHAYNPEAMDRLFGKRRITETFIGSLPLAKTKCQAYLPLMPAALGKLDFTGYDLVLSSESGPAKGIAKPEGCVHICYCHSPMRYVWDLHDEYYRTAGLGGKLAMKMFTNYMRKYDLRSATCVDHFIANSEFVAERINRIYGRESVVVYPPVDYGFYSAKQYPKQDYYLFVGELIPYKRPDLALAACEKLGRKLVVIGSGAMEKELKKKTRNNVTFLGRIPKEEMRRCYAEARGLIFPGIEDFGIVPLEAQSAGTPVLALGIGGALETVKAMETGMFFQDQRIDTMVSAMKEFENRSWDGEACQRNAKRFATEVFRANFLTTVKQYTGC